MRRVDRWEAMAFNLANEIAKAIPEQYRTNPPPQDWVARAWKDTYEAAVHLWTQVTDLDEEVRARLGLPGDGPTAEAILGQSDPVEVDGLIEDGETAETADEIRDAILER